MGTQHLDEYVIRIDEMVGHTTAITHHMLLLGDPLHQLHLGGEILQVESFEQVIQICVCVQLLKFF